ncbi:hypothetical protein AAG570_005949, partial [Ranatra chinensis]
VYFQDRGIPPRNSSTTINVTVIDNDDQPPRFTSDVYRTQIVEFYPITGKKVHKPLHFNPPIEAYDQDRGINVTLRYELLSGNERRHFWLDPHTGLLYVEQEIDLETLPGSLFSLQIQASQTDNPLKTSVARIEIEVLDLNDNQPKFEVESYNISIVENLPNGFSVLQVIASDNDKGDNGEFIYHLVDPSQAFSIDSRSGWLTVRNQVKLDRETKPTLTMRVYAREKMPSAVSSSSDSFVIVEVTLLDANDNNPVFVPNNLYEFVVSSRASVGHLIGKVEAVDPDLGRNGMVLYELKRDNMTGGNLPFVVSPQTGQIRVAESPLAVGRRALFVEASDQPVNPSERRFSLAVVTIDIIESEKLEVKPDFIGAPYEFWVGDDVPIGTSIGQVRVTQPLNKPGTMFDLLHSYHEGVPFAVEESSGTITVVNDIGKFENSFYDFEAVVTNGRSITIITNVTIHVVDSQISNMKNPNLLEFRVRENLSGAMVGRIVAGVKSGTRSRPLRFSIANQGEATASLFAVSQDGTLYTQKELDREVRDTYFITVVAHSGRGDRYYQVHVIVEDENDNPPAFDRSWYEGRVSESCPSRHCLVSMQHPVRVADPDSGPNADFAVVLRGEGGRLFSITSDGAVVLHGGLDREAKDVYSLTIMATDRGNLSSQVRLTIYVDDVNDNPPRIAQVVVPSQRGVHVSSTGAPDLQVVSGNKTLQHQQSDRVVTIRVPEDLSPRVILFRVFAVDEDLGENGTVSYSISSETHIPSPGNSNVPSTHHFTVHPLTGEVAVAAPLPPESEFLLNMTAFDVGSLSDWTIVRVKVYDINNNLPIFEKPWYDFQALEGVYSGQVIGRVLAVDSDFGANANINYSLLGDNGSLPFGVTPLGEVTLNGKIDREILDLYSFHVLAEDGAPLEDRMKNSVEVLVHVLDSNDNAPVFYGYDRVTHVLPSSLRGEPPDGFERHVHVPVYTAKVVENNTPGIPVARVFANDSDLPDNGNGIVIYEIYRKNKSAQLFSVDKEGIVTATGSLDYETSTAFNVTILASDLGTPSLTSTALLIVSVVDVKEKPQLPPKPLVAHNYYELEVEENCRVPLELLKINITNGEEVRFSLVPTLVEGAFQVDPTNGTLYLMRSPDREVTPVLQAKVKVNPVKRGRSNGESKPRVVYPLYPDDLAPNEVKVVLRVKDVNDNSPKFTTNGRPLVAAIPATARYGYPIVRVHAVDQDEGINGEIRYEILTRNEGEMTKFAVDPNSGQVRAVVSFRNDVGKVYGFDVKATDRKGSDDGRSAIANVFVYILDEQKKLIMMMGSKPIDIERNIDNITMSLSNITGLDVRVRKLEPHYGKEATDVYLYALDPLMNVVVDMDTLKQVLTTHMAGVKKSLYPHHMLSIAVPDPSENLLKKRHAHGSYRERSTMSALEMATIALGCIVFLGAAISAFCVICLHKKRYIILPVNAQKKKLDTNFSVTHAKADLLFCSSEAMDAKPRSLFHPSAFVEDSTDSYGSNPSAECVGARFRRSGGHPRHAGGPVCPRHSRRNRRGVLGHRQVKTSLASVHSSGRDSGIVEPHHATCCPCAHTPTHSSNSSHGSYEDSLKSLHRQHSHSSGGGQSGSCLHSQPTLLRRKSYRGESVPIQTYPPVPPLSRIPSERHIVC